MERSGQLYMIKKPVDPFFIDKWCAKKVRKISFCAECYHYEECCKLGYSCSPMAQAHANINIPENPWDKKCDDD